MGELYVMENGCILPDSVPYCILRHTGAEVSLWLLLFTVLLLWMAWKIYKRDM